MLAKLKEYNSYQVSGKNNSPVKSVADSRTRRYRRIFRAIRRVGLVCNISVFGDFHLGWIELMKVVCLLFLKEYELIRSQCNEEKQDMIDLHSHSFIISFNQN